MSIFKSIGAIVAGILVVVILSVGTDFILGKLGVFPSFDSDNEYYSTWMLLIAFAYRCIYAIAGGYVAALLSPSLPMRHVIILGVIGVLANIAGLIAGWNLSAHWYPIALIITTLPCTRLGGELKAI